MVLAAFKALFDIIISAISLTEKLKGKIVFTVKPASNNIESTADKKHISFIIQIANTFSKPISLTCFSVENNNNKLNSETLLYLSPRENPSIGILNIPPGETTRIMVTVHWQGELPRKLIWKYKSSKSNKEKRLSLKFRE